MKIWLPLAFLLALLCGLVSQAPANKVLAYAVPAQAPMQIREVSGRLLEGRIGYLDAGRLAVEDLDWRLDLWPLLLGRLAADVELKPAGAWAQGRLSAGLGGKITVTDLRATATLENLKKPLNLPFLPVSGQLSAEIERLKIEEQRLVEAHGTLRLGNTVWSLTRPPAALGLFSATIRTEDEAIIADIGDQDAQLAVSGEARLNADQSYLLNLRLKAKADTPAPVANNLKTLGRTDSQGWYQINQRGQLPGS